MLSKGTHSSGCSILQALPVQILSSLLKRLHREFLIFLWADASPQISLKILTLPKAEGGIGFPDPILYQQVVHLSRVIDWCCHGKSKQWITVEQILCLYWLPGLPWPLFPTTSSRLGSPLIALMLKIFKKASLKLGMPGYPSPLSPILGSPSFPSNMELTPLRRNQFRAHDFMDTDVWSAPQPLSTSYSAYLGVMV